MLHTFPVCRHTESVAIVSFGDEASRDLYRGLSTARARKFPHDIRKSAQRKLELLEAAIQLADLNLPPGNRLEALKGDRAGYHSIRINDQWRVTFKWTDAGPAEVKVEDYHR